MALTAPLQSNWLHHIWTDLQCCQKEAAVLAAQVVTSPKASGAESNAADVDVAMVRTPSLFGCRLISATCLDISPKRRSNQMRLPISALS